MKNLLLMILAASAFVGCNGQDHKTSALAQHEPNKKIEKPKGNWTVNKEVDEHGNIIKYDSIYSYASSDELNGLSPQDLDSVMKGFTRKFEKHSYSSGDENIQDMLGKESPFSEDMLNDIFGDDMSNGSEITQKMKARMEAMRSQMQQGQSLIPALPEDDSNSSKNN